jgi:hypothetical protein
MSDLKTASPSVLQQIPVELWSKILHTGQGFTVEDVNTLCFVAPIFRTVCQPLLYKRLSVRGGKRPSEYSFERAGALETMHDVEQWKRDVAGLIRAERRLRLVGDDPSLSTYPQTILIGVMPGSRTRNLSAQPTIERTGLSKAAYYAFSQFNTTLLRTLPSFTCLCRLEINLVPIDHGLLTVIASHTTLYELKLGACSFSSPTFPIPSIRSLELGNVSQEQAPAAFCLASSHHLEELRIEYMDVSAILEGLGARPKSESMFMKLNRLTIVRTAARLNFVDVEALLSYMPALVQLDFGDSIIKLPDGNHSMNPSTIPSLRRISGPLSFAGYVVPGRPVIDIRSDGLGGSAELQDSLGPLRLSTATPGGITTLHLPIHANAPIWLLSRFVAETFPNLVDLRLPVRGLVSEPEDRWFAHSMRNCCSLSRRSRRVGVEGPFEEGKIEGMVKDIRDSVENELVGGFDDEKSMDYATRRVSPPPAPIPVSMSSLDIDVVAALARFCTDVVLDSTGTLSRHPKDYQVRRIDFYQSSCQPLTFGPFPLPMNLQEALIYLARGWYPLPAGIQSLTLRPGVFPNDRDSTYLHPFGPPRTVYEMTCRAVVTALGERYPRLRSVTLMGSNGYRCTRTPGIGNGAARWTILAP